jgi:hypothetical protein
MPCRYGSTVDHRIPVELIEADFEIGFNLVDLADSRPSESLRILLDAEAVHDGILARVKRLDASESSNFQPLVGELRREIDLALARHSGARGKCD